MIQSLTIFVCLKAPIEQKMRLSGHKNQPEQIDRNKNSLSIGSLPGQMLIGSFASTYNMQAVGDLYAIIEARGGRSSPRYALLPFRDRVCLGAPRTLRGVIGPARVGEVFEGGKVGNTYLIRGQDLRKVS